MTLQTFAISPENIHEARSRIRSVLPVTLLSHSPTLSEALDRRIYLKWENKFKTGSFKERGAANFLLSLAGEQRSRGVCAASAGNHALALSYHAGRLGIPCTLVMPNTAPLVKVQTSRQMGARVILQGDTFDEAVDAAQTISAQGDLLIVPGYDHPAVMAGQGTAGLEILEQCPEADSVVIPIGGGGLIAGMAIALKAARPDLFILGVESEWAAQMRAENPSLRAKPLSLADGIAVKRIGRMTGPVIEALVDEVAVISESEIAHAIIQFLELERSVVEGAGAAALGAVLAGRLPAKYKHTVVMVSGSNMDMNVLSHLIEHEMARRRRLVRLSIATPDRPGMLHAITGMLAQSRANVMQVLHDRSFSEQPNEVNIIFTLEVRDEAHWKELLKSLTDAGMRVRELAGMPYTGRA